MKTRDDDNGRGRAPHDDGHDNDNDGNDRHGGDDGRAGHDRTGNSSETEGDAPNSTTTDSDGTEGARMGRRHEPPRPTRQRAAEGGRTGRTAVHHSSKSSPGE